MRRAQLCLAQQLLRCSLHAPLAAESVRPAAHPPSASTLTPALQTLPRTACLLLSRAASSAAASSSAEAAASATPAGVPSRGFSAGAAASVAPAERKQYPKPWEVDGVFVVRFRSPPPRRQHQP